MCSEVSIYNASTLHTHLNILCHPFVVGVHLKTWTEWVLSAVFWLLLETLENVCKVMKHKCCLLSFDWIKKIQTKESCWQRKPVFSKKKHKVWVSMIAKQNVKNYPLAFHTSVLWMCLHIHLFFLHTCCRATEGRLNPERHKWNQG